MKQIVRTFFFFAVVVCSILFSSCKNQKKTEGNRIITVTIEPLRFFTEQIAGELFSVVCMVPKGSSPETYEPAPRQLVDLSNSEAYLKIGAIGFEQVWMDRLIDNAPKMKVFDTSEGVEFIREPESVHGNHTHQGGIEPHIWSSPANARLITANIYKALCTLSPQDSVAFRERREVLDSIIDSTDRLIRESLSHGADSIFLIYHPALSYFARDYGLKQISIEHGGKEPSPAYLKSLIDFCRENKVRIIFVQREFDTRNAELIAAETGTRIISINPLSYNWAEEILHIAKALQYDE